MGSGSILMVRCELHFLTEKGILISSQKVEIKLPLRHCPPPEEKAKKLLWAIII
jgi:hypothetical protein